MRRVHWTQNQRKPVLETVHGLDRAKHWRKGSHWKALIRKHAQLAADDRQLVDALSQDCKDCHVRPLGTAEGCRGTHVSSTFKEMPDCS